MSCRDEYDIWDGVNPDDYDDELDFLGAYEKQKREKRWLADEERRQRNQWGGSDDNQNDEGCFITTACIVACGLPDDCEELMILRNFRDTWLKKVPGGEAEITEYYDIAPAIVANIEKSEDGRSVFKGIYEKMVKPCVDYIRTGRNEEARALYRDTVLGLKRDYLK